MRPRAVLPRYATCLHAHGLCTSEHVLLYGLMSSILLFFLFLGGEVRVNLGTDGEWWDAVRGLI